MEDVCAPRACAKDYWLGLNVQRVRDRWAMALRRSVGQFLAARAQKQTNLETWICNCLKNVKFRKKWYLQSIDECFKVLCILTFLCSPFLSTPFQHKRSLSNWTSKFPARPKNFLFEGGAAERLQIRLNLRLGFLWPSAHPPQSNAKSVVRRS